METIASSNPERVRLSSEYDPITFSVLLSRFDNIAKEMTLTLEYTAWTSILALARDYSCAIYDAEPRQVCMFDAIPVHTTSMHIVLAEIARSFEGDIHDGDVFLCNSPYRGNTHVGDVVTAAPVFVEGRHMFWSVTKGHQLDIGASVPSSLSAAPIDCFQEGLHIPPVKIFDAGKARQDVIDLYLANLRYADLLRGDMLAQLGSIGKGRARLIELVEDYGVDETLRYVDAIIDYAHRRMAAEVRAMPDGTYEGTGWVDSDGQDRLHIPVHVTVTIDDDQIKCDLTGSGPQSPSGVNASYAVSQAAPAVPFMYYIDPETPHNHGSIQHITIHAPEGTIVHASPPGSTSMATVVPGDMMQDAVNKAMAHALPERVAAGGARGANLPQAFGVDAETGQPWGAMFFNGGGGGGAVKGVDGWPLFATQAGLGGLKSLVIEQLELLYPLLIEQMEIEPDSMGFGQWIGGPGVRFVIRPTGDACQIITFGDGCDNPPHGVLGGTPGIGGGQYLENRTTGERTFMSAPAYFTVALDEARVGVSTGGGGYGRPDERDAERVLDDVRDGIVSRDAAAEEFGVIFTGDGPSLAIDEEATARRRAELVKKERPIVDPTTPGAGTWAKDNMQEGDTYVLNVTTQA